MPNFSQGHKVIIPKKETPTDEWQRANNAWEYQMRKTEIPPLASNYFGDGSDGDVVISVDTELTSTEDGDIIVKNYGNLTIDVTKTLTLSDRCRGMLLFVDGDLTVNGKISMIARGCHANPVTGYSAGWLALGATTGYDLIGNMTAGGGLASGFDGVTVSLGANGPAVTALTGYIGVDFKVKRKLYKAMVYAPADYGFGWGGTNNIIITIQGSDDNFSADINDLETTGSFVDATSTIKTIEFTGDYRYYRAKIVSDGGVQVACAEVKFFGDASQGWVNCSDQTFIGNMTSLGGLANGFDGLLHQGGAGCPVLYGVAAVGYCGVDFGSVKEIFYAKTFGCTEGQGYCNSGNVTITLQGSDDDFTTDVNDLDEIAEHTPSVNAEHYFYPSGDSWNYRSYRLKLVTTGADVYFSELQLFGEGDAYWDVHAYETPVGPGDGNAVGANGIRFPFLTDSDIDTLAQAEFEGCGTALYNLIASFPELASNGKIIAFPRVGGAGGAGRTSAGDGNNGDAGSTNECGGGGSGGAYDTATGDDGGIGTCFSGGSGAGAVYSTGTKYNTSDYGGQGGDGSTADANSGGGAGNPAGSSGANTPQNAEDGTGGLLIIICSGDILGSGSIESHGMDGGDGNSTLGSGGGSGGGNILVARVGTDATVSKTASGGLGGTASARNGGNGGAGSIQTLQIRA